MAPTLKSRINVTLSTRNLEWFKKEFGEDVAISWYLDLVLEKASQIHKDTGVHIKDVIRDAIKEVEEELEDED